MADKVKVPENWDKIWRDTYLSQVADKKRLAIASNK